jgi:hypothetical protein
MKLFIKFICILFLVILFSGCNESKEKVDETVTVFSNDLAFPIKTKVLPVNLNSVYKPENLNAMLYESGNISWSTSGTSRTTKFQFNGKVIRRLHLFLTSESDSEYISVNLIWIPKNPQWSIKKMILQVKSNDPTQCFFIDGKASIPANVEVEEIMLEFPARITLKSLSFSEQISDKEMLKCPMPELGAEIDLAFKNYLDNPDKEELEINFLELFNKSLYRYDCRRSFDYASVPALWLWDTSDIFQWLNVLSKMKSDEARKVFSSQIFRDSLDGESAELYYKKSENMEKIMNNDIKTMPGN